MKQELLLSLLETNARYSTRDLADILLEDEDSVIHTMNELEKKKIICGYHTIINWDKTNRDKVMAMIEVEAVSYTHLNGITFFLSHLTLFLYITFMHTVQIVFIHHVLHIREFLQ